MARYAETLKNRVVAKLLPPESASVSAIAKEVGVTDMNPNNVTILMYHVLFLVQSVWTYSVMKMVLKFNWLTAGDAFNIAPK
jgi:hypothetical protein